MNEPSIYKEGPEQVGALGGDEELDRLDSDELGAKGESRFAELCADAKLTANKSDRDRAGWDYVVNARINLRSRENLDNRPAPLSCIVQVKSMWSDNDRVRVRLSSAEQLAKDMKPAFIIFLKFHRDKNLHSMHLMHLSGNSLSRILTKLRETELRSETKLNETYVEFSATRDAERIEPTGEAFRTALVRLCGSDPAEYTSRKMQELKEIGFDDPPIHVVLRINASSEAELIEKFLGAKAEFTGVVDSIVETRFGIGIERVFEPAPAQITFQHFSSCECEIVLQRRQPRQISRLSGELYQVPVPLRGPAAPKLFDTQFLKVKLVGKNMNIKSKSFDTDVLLCSIDGWIALVIAHQVLNDGSGEIELRAGGRKLREPLRGNKLYAASEESLANLEDITSKLKLLLESAGAVRTARLTYNQLFREQATIIFLYQMLKEPESIGKIEFELIDDPDFMEANEISGRFMSYIQMGGEVLIWDALVIFEVNYVHGVATLVSKNIELGDVVFDSISRYEDEVNEAKNNRDEALLFYRNFPGASGADVQIVKFTLEK